MKAHVHVSSHGAVLPISVFGNCFFSGWSFSQYPEGYINRHMAEEGAADF